MHKKIDTSTIEGKIAVMQAFADGKKIEVRWRHGAKGSPCATSHPGWNWADYDYRIKHEPEVLYKHPFSHSVYTKEQKNNLDNIRRDQGCSPHTWVKFVEVIED